MSEVAEILRSYPPDCQPTQVEPLGNAGGLSGAQFWRLVAPRGALGLRCWPIEHPSSERLGFIHAVLRHAAERGIDFVSLPISTLNGATFIQRDGRLWDLTPWLPGAPDYEQSPSAEKLQAAMVALARFHVAVGDIPASTQLAPAPAILQRLKRLREFQSGGISTLARAIDENEHAELAPLARRFAAELPRAMPLAIDRLAPLADTPLLLQVCIRDVWSDNVLFTRDTVTGLVDFGAVDIDAPVTDIARLLGSLVRDPSDWKAGLVAYSAIRPLTIDEQRAIPALDAAGNLLAGCNWLRWIYVEGRIFPTARQIAERFRKIVDRTLRLH